MIGTLVVPAHEGDKYFPSQYQCVTLENAQNLIYLVMTCNPQCEILYSQPIIVGMNCIK